jgi:ActR/RegA family two-component response regulator
MRQSAAVLCHDKKSLQSLEATLDHLAIDVVACPTQREALELVVTGRCSTLIVDFDLPGAEEVIRTAALLPPAQKPALLAVASRAWPGTGQAFQSGASRILYRPLDGEQVKNALQSGKKAARKNLRKSARYEMKTLVYLEHDGSTLPAISIDIGEHGLAVQATEPVPMSSSLHFRCMLPGTDMSLQGQVDVIWASDRGRAGLFFSKLAPAARKHLKKWLNQRASHSKQKDKESARDLMLAADTNVSFAGVE